MTRWLRRIALGALALLLIAAAAVVGYSFTLPEDELEVVEPAALVVEQGVEGTLATGGVEVTLGPSGLTLVEDGRIVWESPDGEAFLAAARGEVAVEEHRGYFFTEVRHDAEWTEQRITGMRAVVDGVLLEGTLHGEADQVRWSARIRERPDGGALLQVEVPDADAVVLSSGRSEGAGVHGFGEQFSDFDLDDRLLPIIVREQGVGRGEQPLSVLADLTNRSAAGDATTTYAAWASWVTEDLRGVALVADRPASHAVAVADTRDDERVALEVWAPTLDAELTAGDSPADLVAERQVGAPTLPGWTQEGAIVGMQGGTEEVRRRVADLRASGAEVSGVWLQDWTGQRTTSFGERLWWTWQLDRERYPAWERLVADLADEGITVTTYVNPFLVDAGPKHDPGIRNLFAEARDAGHLVERPDGSPYLLDQGGFDAALVDLTDPAARDWFVEVIAEEVLGAGVGGFMADFGEGLPFDARLHAGDARLAHNAWPGLWAETVREACERAARPDCVTWFRSGSLGMGEDASLFWNGDQLVDFGAEDGLRSALLGTFSAGVSGWPLVHSDIGGYTSVDAVVTDYVRTDELLKRWTELAAFGVVMRTHEGNRPDDNVQVHDDEQRAHFGRMTRVFAALAPYRRAVLTQATEEGLPAIRHGWLVAPGSDAAEVDTQFFLGDALLVAPVLDATTGRVEVTFPPGEWRHLITGKAYEEGTTEVEALVGRPAAFVRTDHPLADALTRDVGALFD
ncbi:alpha-glucosidase [Nocardioides euryhalodurans]|uniref:Alpha-glucosidase n=1 Tax=Nocardioides euryhalodurans TaxID=2518370 RepID=A0A4P7GKE2_9ACTN|nr:alpha-glucosidase [Nocardioides euryhalodurans]QBR92244.1 alpha-glucosidase [Nocardioides euryhalodurans]